MQKRELIRIAESLGVGTKGAKVRFSEHSSERHGRGYGADVSVTGVFQESSGGYGFVSSEEYEQGDIFIPSGKLGGAIDGDTVEVYFHEYRANDGRLRTEGRISKILSYGRCTVIGTLTEDIRYIHRRRICQPMLIPDDPRIHREVYISQRGGANVGDKVEAKIIRSKTHADFLLADVTLSFGKAESREANYLAILNECGIQREFTPEEILAAEQMAALPICEEGRVRQSGVIFTIDSETAKDLDDAISLTKIKGGKWRLGVHIADVSHYVREKTVLDRLAMTRGTSVYFTDKVVPMLPEALSNGACSLNPGEDKYTLSAIITLSELGEIEDLKIQPSIIRSRIKGIYSEINKIFDGTADEALIQKYKECLPSLKRMHELYKLLLGRAEQRGAMNLEGDEAYIYLDENGEPCDIVKCERGDAEKLIEQFMLTANEAVARELKHLDIPCVYRVHEAPPEDKLNEFITYAKNLGLNVRGIASDKRTSADFSNLLSEARKKELAEPISYAMLRAMSKAVYSEIQKPHFGLSIDKYCHFTSPIRRLSDLATHRIIHRVLLEGRPPERYRSYAARAASAATDGELRAVTAERKIEALYKVLYMKKRLGEQFPARISGISSHGLFAKLENTCEGLIPISSLDGFFTFDEGNLTLRDDKTVYKIGMPITVKLEEADVTHGKLRFSLV